ncbi:hypothetical protein HDV01_005402 [Terramyces sp. JEL0728]|nr:hypothetical protein HDV01_005402 [Terramyces sp. JEL0728]
MVAHQIMKPLFGMVTLTASVWGIMYYQRITTFERLKLNFKGQTMAAAKSKVENLPCAGSSDNLKNLFEVPVLYYALVPIILHYNIQSDWLETLAWTFVGLRAVHSSIQCFLNKTEFLFFRFCVYATSCFTLAGMWFIVGNAIF